MFSHSRRLSIGVLASALAALFLVAFASGCAKLGSQATATPGPGTPSANTPQLPLATEAGTPGPVLEAAAAAPYQVSVRLSAGQSLTETVTPMPVASGEPLPPDDVASILARLPTLVPAPEDQTAFKPSPELVPPPLTGQTVQNAFPPAPPAVTPPSVAAAQPLKVLRYAPEGDIPIAPFVSVTFDQPMVPVGTLGDLAADAVPVHIDPALPGTWRWLGTKTLTFEYDSTQIDRLPKATEYRVTVPAGTTSANGGKLAQAVEWTFRTPPPKVVTTYPDNSPQPLDPVFFVEFDQRIDPAAVLKTTKVIAKGQPVSVALAGNDAIQKDSTLSSIVKSATDGRWLAFQAAAPLPAGADVSVTIGPGTPSAEGPLVTTDAQTYTFATYSPLAIEDHGCSWTDNNECRPLTPFFIRFNNPLDVDRFSDSMVTVSPAIPGLSVTASGDTIDIQGETKGQTTYQVTVDGRIQDTFGQQLGNNAVLTFKVGAAQSLVIGPGQTFVTVDPSAQKPVFSVYAVNYNRLAVKIFAVQPSDWPGFEQYLQNWQQTNTPPPMPGRVVFDQTLPVEAPADTLTQVDIDLSKYMDGAYGHFVVIIAPPAPLLFENDEQKYQRFAQTVISWVQVTQIGLDAYNDGTNLLAWASALKDGAPLAGVSIQPNTGGTGATTGADGTVRFAIPSGAAYLVAKQGADQALLPHSNYCCGGDTWSANPPGDVLRWYVFDDRQMYRPGEDVHVKGWLRRVGGAPDGDVGLVGDAVSSVHYQITSSQGNDLGNGDVKLNALGGFDLAFTLPGDVNLGPAQIDFTSSGAGSFPNQEYLHSFQIQEFRRPEFEVSASNQTPGPYFAGDHATVGVAANYYAGGPLPNADVTWNVTYSPGSYSPPNWPDYTFGTWQPWWEMPMVEAAAGPFLPPIGKTGPTEIFTGTTDASGNHYLRLDFDASNLKGPDPRPFSVSAEATVMDVNRQAWTSTTSLLVHPASLYVGIRSDRYFVEHGTPLNVDYIVTDLDGNAVADRPVEITAARMEWKFKDGNWQEVPADIQTCNSGSTLKPGTCTFQTPVGGSYQITAKITDSSGRPNQSQFTRWVSGGQLPPARQVTQEKATLIPDKQTYQPGDVAQILVQSPFSPAEGLLTVSRGGMLYSKRFHLDNGSATLQIPIEAQYVPNLNVQVDLVGSAPRTDDQGAPVANVPARPAFASGQIDLSIPPLQRTLSLDVTPGQKELAPGGQTTVTVAVKDAAGAPVPNAEVAVVVVDESILALTDYQLADPVAAFYFDRSSELNAVYGRSSIVLLNPAALASAADLVVQRSAAAGQAPMAMPAAAPTEAAAQPAPPGAGGANAAQAPIAVRSNFNPLALFAASETTDAGGQATVSVSLPDNLTRYRIMAVAVDGGTRFGKGEANLTARLPLMVRPSAPRFLNFGDKFDLPVVLQNQTDSPLDVNVAVRADNLVLTGPVSNTAGLKVTVPARDRVEVRFPATTDLAGTARLQIAAVSGDYADAATVEIPVYTPATTEAFATYGVVDQGTLVQPVQMPTGVFPQYGGLEINTSSTALQALTDAVVYLVSYPYEGSEELASRVLAISSLRDVLTAFQAKGLPAPADLEASVQNDIVKLQGLQNDDGGFPYWRRGFDSVPFNTIHVAHALVRAQAKGFAVPPDMLQRSLAYLRDIESHYPSWYDAHTRQTLSAYALYVRNLAGDRDPDKALKLLNSAGIDHLSLEAIGWLWPVLEDAPQTASALDTIRTYVNNHVVETPGAANFTTDYDDQTYLLLSSDRRTDAIVLDALITDSPQSDLIPKVVNGLLAHRTQGRWGSTQESVFVLLALDHYFQTYEAQTPDFVARLWLGDTYAGSQTFQGRTTVRQETTIPMAYLTGTVGALQNFIIDKSGTGRLYYRLGLTYAPTSLNLDALDMGFSVQRRYEAVDDPADVSLDQNGVWHIRAGARVRVHLTMVADDRRYHVALVDPLPAGLEIVNPALAVSGSTPQNPSDPNYRYGWWWWSTWYEYQNMLDNQAEAFTSLLWDGVYEYTYIARATTPGTFVVPPAKAEEMYSPEVFGRSHSDQVIVESR